MGDISVVCGLAAGLWLVSCSYDSRGWLDSRSRASQEEESRPVAVASRDLDGEGAVAAAAAAAVW